MAMERKASSTRKPPEPSERGRADIDDWMRRVMPDLQPVVEHIDRTIRDAVPDLQYALKWKKAYYGLPEVGWIVELVAYDVSVNVVFLGGADLDPVPPLGEGRSRYVKVKTVEEVEALDLAGWVRQAATVPGWR